MKIGRYQIVGTLGSGGMSSVSLARSESGALVVLKRQLNPREDDALLDEARVGIRLSHPHIVDYLDLFLHEERPVLVVEYVSGATLADLKACGPLPPGLVCRIGFEIASALHFLHTATEEDGTPLNMLHRDVTPSNIIVGHDGHARLIDFGIARSAISRSSVTQEGVLKGTLRYLAPELLEDGGTYSVATDLWGLGMTLWEAALGRLAVEGDDPLIFASIISGRAMKLQPGEDLDPRLRAAVAQLLSTAPDCRPPTAHHAAEQFGVFLSQFEELDALAEAYVTSAVGPANTRFDEKTTLQEAHLLVNRAAATYGGPRGDWRLTDDVVRSSRVMAIDAQGFDDVALTEPMAEAAHPRISDSLSLPSETEPVGAAHVPAPVDLPSLPSGPHGEPVGESTEEVADDLIEEVLEEALPLVGAASDAPPERTEIIRVDLEEVKLRARAVKAREIAKTYAKKAASDPWIGPLTNSGVGDAVDDERPRDVDDEGWE